MEKSIIIPKKMSNSKLKLSDLNPHLMCVLCGGYYIDATTIVECLHSFCRSCIVKHLESSKYCPICEVQVHKTKPLINIRPDKTLQDIVYKLVPGLFASEMKNRRKFYKERPHYIKPSDSESAGEVSGERKIYVNDENITFSLVYHTEPINTSLEESYREISPPSQNEKRYFKCPTGVTIRHLKKLLRAKYELSENNYKMQVYFQGEALNNDLTLLDISYIYLWKSKGSLDLTYKIFENVVKRQKVEETNHTGIIDTPKHDEVVVPRPASQPPNSEPVQVEPLPKEEKVESPKPEVKSNQEVGNSKAEERPEPKENGVTEGEVKEVQLQISESGVMSVSQVQDGEVVRTVEETATKVTNYQVTKDLGVNKEIKGNGEVAKQPETVNRVPEKKPQTKPVKPYKTIRYSPKTWHPVIPKEKLRPTLIKNSDEPKKPLKFFKMRNMPRFLGNPSSGVKPMYAESLENSTEEKKKPDDKKPEPSKNINKILKIDPKTLRPIEKEELKVTPNTPNLLTNPFIPNNNHFLFSDLHLLPPNSGNYSNSNKPEPKAEKPPTPGYKSPLPNGSYPPICFPTPDHSSFYPFSNLSKPPSFPFPPGDKMDPLLRATRLSPFGNLAGFNVAGFHASLPPSISRLLNPHQHFRKINQALEKKNKDESTKETSKSCDDNLKVSKATEKEEKKEENKIKTTTAVTTKTENKEEKKESRKEESSRKEGEAVEVKNKETEEKEKKKKINGENIESASKTEIKSDLNVTQNEKDKVKDKDR